MKQQFKIIDKTTGEEPPTCFKGNKNVKIRYFVDCYFNVYECFWADGGFVIERNENLEVVLIQ